jgi:aspartyl/asparaginyl beta-hydroxylase (cupin superfamily)
MVRGRYKKMALGAKHFAAALLALLGFLIFANVVDAVVGKRSIIAQLRLVTIATAPLNAAVHWGTPSWLQQSLQNSGILVPSKKLFPNVDRLRLAFSTVQREARAAMIESKPIKNDLYFQGLADDGWKRFYIKWYGPIDPKARMICPETSRLLESMPEVHLGMFSILMPGSRIPPHFGPARMCLRYHMGIFTPNDEKCRIKVGNDSYFWKDGEDVMFDDTIQHEVINDTDKPRIILFLDIERPQNRGIFSNLTKAMIKHGGPLTTRSNDYQEKVVKSHD